MRQRFDKLYIYICVYIVLLCTGHSANKSADQPLAFLLKARYANERKAFIQPYWMILS